MNIKITGIHFDVTEAVKNRVETKLARINRHSDSLISASVTLSVDKLDNKAATQIHLAGKDIYVEATGNDMYCAIDSMAEKLDRAILQYKEKYQH